MKKAKKNSLNNFTTIIKSKAVLNKESQAKVQGGTIDAGVMLIDGDGINAFVMTDNIIG